MTSLTLAAPAKINLFLKVLNKRRDSYHNIITLFEKISLADSVKISKIPKGIRVSSDKFITSGPEDNLAYKAARLIMERGKIKGGVSIRITKRIPVASGLGGGSSDAASTLIGMVKLFGLKFDRSDLLQPAAALGADVPFFISAVPFAVGEGRGDKIRSIDIGTRPWHLIVYPGPLKAATRDIYEAFDALAVRRRLRQVKGSAARTRHKPLSKNLTAVCPDAKMKFLAGYPMTFDGMEAMLHNDLEDAVTVEEEAVADIIKRLAAFLGKKFIVSGSGPSVFCLYRTRKEAIEAKEGLFRSVPAVERKDWQVFIAGTAG